MKLNGWKRLGILASVVWIIAAFFYTFHTERQRDIRMYVTAAETGPMACPPSLADTMERHDAGLPSPMECMNEIEASIERALPIERKDAAIVALVPVPFAWLGVYLIIFFVKWVRRGFVAGGESEDPAPQTCT
jgi:hypothetical protein